jgi:hypothetical protein
VNNADPFEAIGPCNLLVYVITSSGGPQLMHGHSIQSRHASASRQKTRTRSGLATKIPRALALEVAHVSRCRS